MRKILRRILLVIYLLAVIPLLACYLSQWISPAVFWPLAFFGLIFPILIAIQISFVLIFILLRSKAVILPILMIALGWGPITRTFQLGGKKATDPDTAGTIQVMTYNVRWFDIAHYWSGQQNQAEGILAFVAGRQPDILCFQEFATEEPGRFSLGYFKSRLPFLSHTAIEYNVTSQNRRHGLAIFSRYPILKTGHEHFQDTRNMMLYADLLVGGDTVRIYNNHLESNHFDREEFQWIDSSANYTRIPRDKLSGIVRRMRGAYVKRASQANVVKADIDRSPYPVIVCGDFNDVPVSYATHTIGRYLYDSFRSGGRWLGITFPNVFAPLRIDYILHSKNLESMGYRIDKVNFSDHLPVSCRIRLEPVTLPGSSDSSHR
jgi:endonuclease/exonuclease/phosphatase family metal-dependent hydrolase